MPGKPITYTSTVGRLEFFANTHYIEVPAGVIKKLGGIKTRLLCAVNGAKPFQCGMMALGEGSAYISFSLKRMKEAGVTYGDSMTVVLEKDESKYGLQIPAELDELLKMDAEGKRRFDLLPMSKQRYVIYYVNGVKSTQLRVDRAILLVENLKKLPEGNESFREMLGLPKKI